MKRYSIGGIFTSLLLVFSIFTLFSIVGVNAEEGISVNANGYENTIIIEFENDSESKIKTARMWLGGEITFESFKSEPGWGGGKYSDGKLVVFTSTNTLNPGESVKFGLVTSEKVDGINWKVLDQNNNDIDKGKTAIQLISEITSDLIEEESKEVEKAKEIGDQLYGTKKFIPEKIRVGSDVRLAGNGFEPGENLKIYLDNNILKSISTDEEGNFLTTISIPDTQDVGTSEFIIKDESGNIQTTNINIEEEKNRFLKTTKFDVTTVPAEIRYDEKLTISGNAYPQSAIILSFEDNNRILEKTRVVMANSNGEWIFEEEISRTENIGEKYVIIENNKHKTTKNLELKSDYLVQISTSAIRYDVGETIIVNGFGEPNKDVSIWMKDEDRRIVHYDVFQTEVDGVLNYELVLEDNLQTGTYNIIVKQESGSDATVFGLGKYPSTSINILMDKANFGLNSNALLSIIGPPSSKLSIQILDSTDSIKITDSITTSSTGKSKYSIDLDDLTSGIYRAVVSTTNIQDSVKFSVGLEPGSGPITLISIQENYSPGDPILVIGSTGVDARITVTLFDINGIISSKTETFSDGSGNFSTSEIGIPTDAQLGIWKITAHSRLDISTIEIDVALPAEKGLTLEIVGTEFSVGDSVMISGIAKTDAPRLVIKIIDPNGQVFRELETPVTGDDIFSVPWIIPNNAETGTYTITVSDTENSNSVEIFIQ